MNYNSTIQSLQNLENQLLTYAFIIIGLQMMFSSMLLFLYAKRVQVTSDIAVNTQKIETGEDYKMVRMVAEIIAIISYLGFFGGLAIIGKTVL